MPKVDLSQIEQTNRTGYPAPLDAPVRGRHYRRLAPALGLEDFGASVVTLDPGAWSSQKHWHEGEDEIVVMLEGQAVLIEGEAETLLNPGDIAAFVKGVALGHHLVNRSDSHCRFIAIGAVAASDCHYPDVDLHLDGASQKYVHKDGSPY